MRLPLRSGNTIDFSRHPKIEVSQPISFPGSSMTSFRCPLSASPRGSWGTTSRSRPSTRSLARAVRMVASVRVAWLARGAMELAARPERAAPVRAAPAQAAPAQAAPAQAAPAQVAPAQAAPARVAPAQAAPAQVAPAQAAPAQAAPARVAPAQAAPAQAAPARVAPA